MTGKQLLKKLNQESFDVKNAAVVFIYNGEAVEVGRVAIEDDVIKLYPKDTVEIPVEK